MCFWSHERLLIVGLVLVALRVDLVWTPSGESVTRGSKEPRTEAVRSFFKCPTKSVSREQPKLLSKALDKWSISKP